MKVLAGQTMKRILVLLLSVSLGVPQTGALAQAKAAFTQEQLDQMLAPIALYPDPLLSQILMASTYPLEVVQAARWSRTQPELTGDAAVRAAEQQNWDPSVKSLVAFPQVLAQLDQNLEWTQGLGDAFLAQEPQVMETVQNLRQKAQAAGNLRTDDRVRVVEQGQAIAVEPADPQLMYVPYYDPRIVYGPWWWQAYPPVYWAPWPGYYARPGISSGFYWGVGIGISAGFFFGAVDWRQRHVRVVNVNNYYYSRAVAANRPARIASVSRAPGAWQHDPAHRRGLAYRDAGLQKQYGRTSARLAEPRREVPRSGAPSPEKRGNPAAMPNARRQDGPGDSRGIARPAAGAREEHRVRSPETRGKAPPASGSREEHRVRSPETRGKAPPAPGNREEHRDRGPEKHGAPGKALGHGDKHAG
jgi:hypothetical protein